MESDRTAGEYVEATGLGCAVLVMALRSRNSTVSQDSVDPAAPQLDLIRVMLSFLPRTGSPSLTLAPGSGCVADDARDFAPVV